MTSRVSGPIHLGVARVLQVVIDLWLAVYLGRQLGPEIFGVVAVAAALMTVLTAFGDAGVGVSLVSDPALSRRRIGAAVLLSSLLACLIAGLALVTAAPVAQLYGDPRIGKAWIVLAVCFSLATMQSVPRALAQRDERFRLLAWVGVVASLAGAVGAVILVQQRQDIWPLLVRSALPAVIGTAALWGMVRPAIGLPSRQDLAEVYRFARGIVAFDLLNTLSRNGDSIVIGYSLGETSLGLYNLAYRILLLPTATLGGVVTTVLYPRLSALMPDHHLVARRLTEAMGLFALVTTPFCVGVIAVAAELVPTVFGPQWSGAVDTVRVLAALSILQAPFTFIGLVYSTVRRTDVMAKVAAVVAPIIIISFLVGVPWGILGVAVSYSTAWSLIIGPAVVVAARTLGVSSRELAIGPVRGIALGLIASAPMVGLVAVARVLELSPAQVVLCTIGVGGLTEAAIVGLWVRPALVALPEAPQPASAPARDDGSRRE